MSLLDRVLPWRRRSASSYDILREIAGLIRRTVTGKHVDAKTAMEVSAVFGCARVISEGIAQVPLKLMQESSDGRQRLPAKKHPLYGLLAVRPNDWQTSFEYREMIGWHAVLCGNAFSFINRLGNGKIAELIPFEPGQVTVKRADTWALTYDVRAANGSTQTFPAEAIWHVRGPSWNSWMGLEAVKIAREAIGLAMATEESQARMHKNGVRASGVYSVEGTLNSEQYKSLKEWIDKNHAGLDNAGGPILLDRSAKWLQTSMSGVDVQHLETRRYQVEEVCRFFRVMPIMLGYSDKAATYASSEQMFLAHVVHTLAPWYQRLEQSIDANLLTEQERGQGYYSSFVEEGLLRGDMKATAEYLYRLCSIGIMDRNEARAKLDMNPKDGLDQPLTPANLGVGADPLIDPPPQGATA